MISEYKEYITVDQCISWKKLPLDEDVKFLLQGKAVFTSEDKKIVNSTSGFYTLSLEEAKNEFGFGGRKIEIFKVQIIDDEKNMHTFKVKEYK